MNSYFHEIFYIYIYWNVESLKNTVLRPIDKYKEYYEHLGGQHWKYQFSDFKGSGTKG